MPTALLEEHLEEVLFRIPPDDPASLLSAALVSKRWCRLICGHRFRHRYRKFHGKPPLLGLVWQRSYHHIPQDRFFIPTTSSFKPRHHGDHRNLKAVHSCHGRVLLYSVAESLQFDDGTLTGDLFVWDPIADQLQKLPRWTTPNSFNSYAWGNGNAAVLCPVLAEGGSDPLDWHHGPFKFMVVLAAIDNHAQTFIYVYSSEGDGWSEPISAGQRYDYIEKGNSVIIGSAVYFKCLTIGAAEPAILKYDLVTQETTPIYIPRVGIVEHINYEYIVLMAMEDGRLGFAGMQNCSTTLSLWSKTEDGPEDEAARYWAHSRVIQLGTLPPHKDLKSGHLVAFADTGGGGVIFIWSCSSTDQLFSLDLKSGSSKVVAESFRIGDGVVPYVSFCTPALGAVSIEMEQPNKEPASQVHKRSPNYKREVF